MSHCCHRTIALSHYCHRIIALFVIGLSPSPSHYRTVVLLPSELKRITTTALTVFHTFPNCQSKYVYRSLSSQTHLTLCKEHRLFLQHGRIWRSRGRRATLRGLKLNGHRTNTELISKDRMVAAWCPGGACAIHKWVGKLLTFCDNLLIINQLSNSSRPVDGQDNKTMTARMPLQSEGDFGSKTSPGARTESARWFITFNTSKIYGARPMSKMFSCCHPIVTAAGRTLADIQRRLKRPAAVSYLWLRNGSAWCQKIELAD